MKKSLIKKFVPKDALQKVLVQRWKTKGRRTKILQNESSIDSEKFLEYLNLAKSQALKKQVFQQLAGMTKSAVAKGQAGNAQEIKNLKLNEIIDNYVKGVDLNVQLEQSKDNLKLIGSQASDFKTNLEILRETIRSKKYGLVQKNSAKKQNLKPQIP